MVRIPLSCWLDLWLAGKQLFLCVAGSVMGILRQKKKKDTEIKRLVNNFCYPWVGRWILPHWSAPALLCSEKLSSICLLIWSFKFNSLFITFWVVLILIGCWQSVNIDILQNWQSECCWLCCALYSWLSLSKWEDFPVRALVACYPGLAWQSVCLRGVCSLGSVVLLTVLQPWFWQVCDADWQLMIQQG